MVSFVFPVLEPFPELVESRRGLLAFGLLLPTLLLLLPLSASLLGELAEDKIGEEGAGEVGRTPDQDEAEFEDVIEGD